MRKTQTVLRYTFAILLIIVGCIGLYALLIPGYNPENVGIMLFGSVFRNLHNAIMLSYLGILIRAIQLLAGILLFTKKYWWLGLLIHLPLAINIMLIHLIHDIPPAHIGFFASGMLVSILNFMLVFYEKDRLKQLVLQ